MTTSQNMVSNKMLIFFTKLIGVFHACFHFGLMLMAIYILAKHAHFDQHNRFEIPHVNNHLIAMPMSRMHNAARIGAVNEEVKPKNHATPVHIFWMRVFRFPIKHHNTDNNLPTINDIINNNNNKDDKMKELIDPLMSNTNNAVEPKMFFEKVRKIFEEQTKTMQEFHNSLSNVGSPFMINQELAAKASHHVKKRSFAPLAAKSMEVVPSENHPSNSFVHWHHKTFKCSLRHTGLYTLVASSVLFMVAIMMVKGVVNKHAGLMVPYMIIHLSCLIYSIIMFFTHLSYLPYVKFWIARMHHHIPLKRTLLAMDTRILTALILIACISFLLLKATIVVTVYLCYRHIFHLNRVNALSTKGTVSVTIVRAKPLLNAGDDVDKLKAELKKQDEMMDKDADMVKLPLYEEIEGRDNKAMDKEDGNDVKMIV